MITDVFAYGSLADPERQKILCGKTFTMTKAVLPGYRLDEQPGCYRMIYEDPGHTVKGVIVREVEADDLKAFDAWEDEGELYVRREALADVEGEGEVKVWVYLGTGRKVKK